MRAVAALSSGTASSCNSRAAERSIVTAAEDDASELEDNDVEDSEDTWFDGSAIVGNELTMCAQLRLAYSQGSDRRRFCLRLGWLRTAAPKGYHSASRGDHA
jgi:hypothetical protein